MTWKRRRHSYLKIRKKIFGAVRATLGGFLGFNEKVVGLIREWIFKSTKAITNSYDLYSRVSRIASWFGFGKSKSLTVEQANELLRVGNVLLQGCERSFRKIVDSFTAN